MIFDLPKPRLMRDNITIIDIIIDIERGIYL